MNYDSPHRRFNPLTGEWVLVSPHRAQRPWLGQVEKTPPESLPPYDPTCYLCPGNERAGGVKNPKYSSTFVFDNDFSALLPEDIPEAVSARPLLASVPVRGLCRVVCFSPRHDLTLPELEQAAIENVLLTWTEQTAWVVLIHTHIARYGQRNIFRMSQPKNFNTKKLISINVTTPCYPIISMKK